MRALVLGLLIAALAAPVHAACTNMMRREAFMYPGFKTFTTPEAPPRIGFTRADGTEGHLDELRGKPSLVTFWFPRCPGCRQEGPKLDAMLDRYKPQGGMNFLAVSVQGDREEVISYLDRNGYGSMDPNIDEGAALFRELCLMATPVHLVLDTEAQMLGVLVGPQDWTGADETAFLESLIATGGI